jgi:undecaprenyl-diphosphatase
MSTRGTQDVEGALDAAGDLGSDGADDEPGALGEPGALDAAATVPTDMPTAAARIGVRSTLGTLAAFLLAVPFTLLLLLVTSESERIERLDRGVADRLHAVVSGQPAATTTLEWIGRVTDPWLLRAGALALAIALAVRGRRRAAAWLVVTVIIGGLVGVGLKYLVGRARPVFDEPVYVATGYSFPSGHALNSLLIALAVLVVLWPGLGRTGRIVGTSLATLFVLVVGWDRVALGVHFVTDVIGGWTVAVAVVAATAAAFLIPDDAGVLPGSGPAPAPTSWPRALGRMLAQLAGGWLAIVTVMVGLGLLLTRVVDDRWPLTEEDAVSTGLERWRTDTWDTATLAMRHIADTPVIIVTMLVVAVALRLMLGRWREGLFVIAATAGQAIVFVTTTAFVERDRPDVEQLDASPPTSSFPSGHTSAALALYLAIATVVLRTVRRPWLRYLLAALLLLPPLAVAFARLYRGMHHPSDVAGSVVNATLCLWLAARVVLHGPLPEDDAESNRDREEQEVSP